MTAVVSTRRAHRNAVAVGTVLLAVLLALAVVSPAIGSEPIPLRTVVRAFTDYDTADPLHYLVVDGRLNRCLVAVLAGLALGAAGAVIQVITRNPLAEPGLLGINSGAATVVALGVVVIPDVPFLLILLLAFAGAAITGTFVLLIGGAFRSNAEPVRLVLAGAATTAVLGAVVGWVLTVDPEKFLEFRAWDAGAVVTRPWPLIIPAAVAITAGLMLCATMTRSLNALALGVQFSRALGASIRRTWALAGVAIVLLAGAATAITGPIGFLGFVAPMIARRLVGPNVGRLLPISMLLGAVLLLAADLVGRVVVRPGELAAAVVCALIGGPVFMVIARRRSGLTL